MSLSKGKPALCLALLTSCLVFTWLMGQLKTTAVDAAGAAGPATAVAPWHTFLGSTPESPGNTDEDAGGSVVVDSAGSAYVAGQSSNGAWGSTPIVTHNLSLDGFLAKVDSSGTLLWHTFVGGSETDAARAITIDDADHLFVAGTSNGGTWSSPPLSNTHGSRDVLVAEFNTGGTRQWFTFVGTDRDEFGNAIALDSTGKIYVGGVQVVNPYLAGLNGSGEFRWQRVITSTSGDLGGAAAIATDQNGDVYLSGFASYGDWFGAPPPVRPHAGPDAYRDAFVAKFDGDDGTLLWHTFLGAANWDDEGLAITVNGAENPPVLYVAGTSSAGWGTPLQPHSGSGDAFLARLNGSDGTLVWHTFVGSSAGSDAINALRLDDDNRLLVAGTSRDSWGNPVLPHPEGGVGDAVFAAAFATDGQYLGHTFLGGSASSDEAAGIAVSSQGNVYVSGTSWSPAETGWSNPDWGTPIRPFSGTHDAFVARLGTTEIVRYWAFVPIIRKP